jgi:aldehyde:ferredoxin oxidoreductase
MDKDDIKTAMDMFYQEMGWDKKTGAPTASTYHKLGLGKVADELSKKGLLP